MSGTAEWSIALSLVFSFGMFIWGMAQRMFTEDAKHELKKCKKTCHNHEDINVELRMYHNHVMTLYIESAKRNRALTVKYNALHKALLGEFLWTYDAGEQSEFFKKYGIKNTGIEENHEDDLYTISNDNVKVLKDNIKNLTINGK